MADIDDGRLATRAGPATIAGPPRGPDAGVPRRVGPARRPTPPGPARRWPWLVAVAVLSTAAAGLGWYGVETRQTVDRWQVAATSWQDRAADETARADTEAARADQERARADGVTAELVAAEAEVAQRDGRIGELAAEKAAVADERELAEAERDLHAGVSSVATTTAAELAACVDEQQRFSGLLLDADASSDWDWLGTVAGDVDEVCGGAFAAVDELSTVLAGLAG